MKLDLITNKDIIDKDKNNNDEHYTPIYAIEPILKYLKPNSNILCPFDISDSNYVKTFEKNGHKVTFSHLETNKDFFTYTKEEIKNSIHNILKQRGFDIDSCYDLSYDMSEILKDYIKVVEGVK